MAAVSTIIDGETFVRATCPECKAPQYFPLALYEVAFARRPDFTVYCPNGHPWHYTRGESELDRIRRERNQLKQALAERDDKISEARRNALEWQLKAQAAAKDARRTKKRVSGGVCPCCSRSFVQMARHMKTKHPNFVAEAVQ